MKFLKLAVSVGAIILILSTLTSCGSKVESPVERIRDHFKFNGLQEWHWENGIISSDLKIANITNSPQSENLTFYILSQLDDSEGATNWEYYKSAAICAQKLGPNCARFLEVDLNPHESLQVVIGFELPKGTFIRAVSVGNLNLKSEPRESEIVKALSACWDGEKLVKASMGICPNNL